MTLQVNGVITLATNIAVTTDTILDGTGWTTTISGNNTSRVFTVSSNVTLVLRNLTVANGMNYAPIAYYMPQAPALGGAIYNEGRIEALGCVFSNNVARSGTPQVTCGGAVYNRGSLLMTNCGFFRNIALGGDSHLGTIPLMGGVAYGGAIYNSGSAVLTGCFFEGNRASGGRGNSGYPGYYSSTPFGPDGGTARGGAVYDSGSLWVLQTTFDSNSAIGGIGGNGGFGKDGQLGENPGQGGLGGTGGHAYGGGLCCQTGTVAIVLNSTFIANSATAGNGGAGGAGGRALSARGAGGLGGNGGTGGNAMGGAMAFEDRSAGMTNITVAFGTAIAGLGGAGGAGGAGGYAGGAGGPHGFDGGPGEAGGANLSTTNGTVALKYSIIAHPHAAENVSGSIVDGGYNLSSGDMWQFTTLTSRNNTDPQLGPLIDNGGPAPTCALRPGSPAIDVIPAGDYPTYDQVGSARPFGLGADIGAVEFSPKLFQLVGWELPDGRFRIQGRGSPSAEFRVQVSVDLIDWVNLSTNRTAADGWFDSMALKDFTAPRQFYRVFFNLLP